MINQFINLPLKAQITKEQNKDNYRIHLEKHGNTHRGISINLTDEQIKQLEWWY